jgi:hypothetical protein
MKKLSQVKTCVKGPGLRSARILGSVHIVVVDVDVLFLSFSHIHNSSESLHALCSTRLLSFACRHLSTSQTRVLHVATRSSQFRPPPISGKPTLGTKRELNTSF